MSILDPGGLTRAVLGLPEPSDPAVRWGLRLARHLRTAQRFEELGSFELMPEQFAEADLALDWLSDATPESAEGVLAQAVALAGTVSAARAERDTGNLQAAHRLAFSIVSSLEAVSTESRSTFGGEHLAHPAFDPRGSPRLDG